MHAIMPCREIEDREMITAKEVHQALLDQPTIPLWPDAGVLLDLSRNATYSAAHAGHIPTIKIGRIFRVPSAPMRRLLGIETIAVEVPAGKAA